LGSGVQIDQEQPPGWPLAIDMMSSYASAKTPSSAGSERLCPTLMLKLPPRGNQAIAAFARMAGQGSIRPA